VLITDLSVWGEAAIHGTFMTGDEDKLAPVEELLATPDLAGALENNQFRRFLDRIPLAIIISELKHEERIVYASPMFEKLSGRPTRELRGEPLTILHGKGEGESAGRDLGRALVEDSERVGTFLLETSSGEPILVDAYSHAIEDDSGESAYRLIALVDIRGYVSAWREQLERQIRDKDTALKELQHRVKNNLQIITALIRLEARNMPGGPPREPFDRLAGRVESLAILYSLLSPDDQSEDVDLGVYLSQIASAVMSTHAVEGIKLDLRIEPYPVSVNVAMPTGLVVNELLTNALKYAFAGRKSGTVTLHSLLDKDGYRVVVADDGLGLPPGVDWPKPGGLGVLILDTLRENAKAQIDVHSSPEVGTRVTILFLRRVN
jgi:PAS domain S-box-containing protein